jgi:hypothetical protein
VDLFVGNREMVWLGASGGVQYTKLRLPKWLPMASLCDRLNYVEIEMTSSE